MKKLSEINNSKKIAIRETYIQDTHYRDEPPKSERQLQIESFAHDKNARSELIKAFTSLSEHPSAKDFSSSVGSAFEQSDLDEEMAAAFEAIGEGGIIYASFEDSFWIRHKDNLIRVM